jgi:3-dehydroquinate dehydratase/shikimate dehydrogenase
MLAEEFSCHVASEEVPTFDTVVNCTPVGMEGGNSPAGDPLHELAPYIELNASIRVIDTVYSPKETPLLQRAKGAGCEVIYGEEMFRLQATEQQRIWN